MKIKNIKITGGNQQFADKIINNSNQLSDDEKTLVDFIIKNTSDEERQAALIKNLEVLKDPKQQVEKKKNAGSVLKSFLESTSNEAGKLLVKELFDKGLLYLEYLF